MEGPSRKSCLSSRTGKRTELLVHQGTEGGNGGGGHGLSNDTFGFVFFIGSSSFLGTEMSARYQREGKAEVTIEKCAVDCTTLAASKDVVYKVQS